MSIYEWILPVLKGKDSVIAVNEDWKILRETEDWVVVDKPAPLIVHPTSAKKEPTLVTLMEDYYNERGEAVSLSLINRLDRETSGCVLVAKNESAARVFGKAMMRREIEKRYLAIVRGWPEWANDECQERGCIIRRGEVVECEGDFVWVQQMVHESGKECVTNFKVVDRYELKSSTADNGQKRFSLIECMTETGRMHQIRVHSEHLGHPLVGDKIYGGDSDCYLNFVEKGWNAALQKKLIIERQALHASDMGFSWKEEWVEVQATLSGELAKFLDGLQKVDRETLK